MIRALLALLAGLVDPAPAVDVDDVDLVPVDCDDCGYPAEYCVCVGYDVSDYYDYVEASR